VRPYCGASRGSAPTSHIHTPHLFRLSQDLPVVIVLADAEDRIRAFLPQLDDLITNGLAVVDEVHAIRYA